ncbi:MAG: DinB family protein [Anaerolineae bacterium]|nr:DinB family protein [Anaerolineae bacterium]
MTAENIIKLFQTNAWVLQQQAKDISHEESLLSAPGHANNMNWAFGHIINGRNRALQRLGAEPVWHNDEGDVYKRGHDPVSAEDALPFDKLMADLKLSQERLEAALITISAEQLAAVHKDNTLEWHLLFAAWHEGYHTGQTEIFRQLAGKGDQIIS